MASTSTESVFLLRSLSVYLCELISLCGSVDPSGVCVHALCVGACVRECMRDSIPVLLSVCDVREAEKVRTCVRVYECVWKCEVCSFCCQYFVSGG